jgi:molybdenum cofactor biosynthesis enzyme MoaA
LDTFYFDLKGNRPTGRITNIWLFSYPACNMNCSFCSVEIRSPFFETMQPDDFSLIMRDFGHAKLTLSGGEPTMHPHLLDFFREAGEKGIPTQLATNGVLLADEGFCNRLLSADVKEVRLSTESFDENGAEQIGNEHYIGEKLRALRNLERLDIKTSLSPTIFKGVNEEHLIECIEFSRDKPYILEISVNGFSWAGSATSLQKSYMIMPDELMDIIHTRYVRGERADSMAFNKLMLITLHLARIRLCMYTQIIIFYRKNGGLVPLIHFFHAKRLQRALRFWERFAHSSLIVQLLSFILVVLFSVRPKAVKLFPAFLRMLAANLFHVNIHRYPSCFLPVVLNTNCSILSADYDVSKQCMSAVIVKQDGRIKRGVSSYNLIQLAKSKFASRRFIFSEYVP